MSKYVLRPCGLLLILFLSATIASAQLAGTINVGTGQTYTTLTAADGLFNAVNNGSLAGDLTVQITSDITEPGTVTLNKWTETGAGNYQIRIIPDGTTERVLSGSAANIFNFSNVRNLVIDGSFSGAGKFLRFIHTHKNANTLAFVNDCKSDTVMNCYFEGVDTAANKSILLIGTTNITGGTGNDSIAILNNIVKDNAAGYPKNLVRSLGTATAPNDHCIISGNEFINWSNEAVGLAAGTGDNWEILNNAFYQSPSASIYSQIIYGIRAIVNSGNGHFISGNSIGGTAPDRSGKPMKSTFSAIGNTIVGIQLEGSGSFTSPIIISKNGISNIGGSQGFSNTIYGIYLNGINAKVDSNIIANLPDTIYSSGWAVTGIYMNNANAIVTNNKIKNIHNNGYLLIHQIIGIYAQNAIGVGRYIIDNNIIDSIVGITPSSYSQNTINSQMPTGIYVNLTVATAGNKIANNKITNVINTTNNSSPKAAGILSMNTSASINIYNNQISNIGGFSNADGQGLGTSNFLYGIFHSSSGNDTIFNNVVNIGNLSYSTAKVTGIYGGAGSNGAHLYLNNTINVTGISRLTSAGDVGGSNAFSGNGNITLRNNILNNKRTTQNYTYPPLPTRNYAISYPATPIKSDYNLLFSVDTIIAIWGSSPKTFATWKAASNGDTNSINAPVTFVSATDLHIDETNANAWNVYGRGIAIPAISTDIDGDSRSTVVGMPVTIGADEIPTPTSVPADMVMIPAIPNPGTPAVFTSGGRRIAEITWTGGVVPNTITGKYYPGVAAPNTTTSPNINSYFELTPDVTAGIPYTIKTYYTDAEAAGIADANLQAIKSHTPGSWIGITPPNANSADANGKYLQSVSLNDFSTFTMTGNSIPLSIDLKTITAQNIGSKNKIAWSTAKEGNEDYFELESSVDGRTFKKIATIMAKGQASTYTYLDEKAVLGMNYYRLKMITGKETFIYSRTVTAEVRSISAFSINVYPNPAANKAVLHIDGAIQDDAMVMITDINGKQLRVYKGIRNEMELDLTGLASGIYFIKYSDSHQSQTVKITKQ